MSEGLINLHHFLARSMENGPGVRAVIWVQGCTLHCPGCFNPDTHDLSPRTVVAVHELAQQILHISDIEGITISGGEPFLQAKPLAELCQIICQKKHLGVIVFSGFTFEQITQMQNPDCEALLAAIDLLIAGPFIPSLACHHSLRGSSNQTFHYLSERYLAFREAIETGSAGVEIIIDAAGTILMTGFPDANCAFK